MRGRQTIRLAVLAGTLGCVAAAPLHAQVSGAARPRARAPRVAVKAAPKPPSYSVYAIRYGTAPAVPLSGFVPGADSTRRMDLAFTLWLLHGSDGRNVLIDAGFYDPREVAQWHVRDFVVPTRAVARAGVAATEITDLIITHAHFDHLGGADLFPRAQVWIQRQEFDSATAGPGQRGEMGFSQGNATYLTRLRERGSVRLLEGDSTILPGIRVFAHAGHTWGCQYVAVNTRSGTVVIASDAVATYENLERHLPNALVVDADANVRALDNMLRLAARPALVVPGHDPDVFRRFPRPGKGVARID